MNHYDVVAAVICYRGKILCLQRGQTRFPYTSYKWEFPGGKIEIGETPKEALHREIWEEMSMDVRVGDSVCKVEQDYPDFSITMETFLCDVKTPIFDMKEHHAFCWLLPEELSRLDWAAADWAVLRTLLRE